LASPSPNQGRPPIKDLNRSPQHAGAGRQLGTGIELGDHGGVPGLDLAEKDFRDRRAIEHSCRRTMRTRLSRSHTCHRCVLAVASAPPGVRGRTSRNLERSPPRPVDGIGGNLSNILPICTGWRSPRRLVGDATGKHAIAHHHDPRPLIRDRGPGVCVDRNAGGRCCTSKHRQRLTKR
jgi:hypothetical protein